MIMGNGDKEFSVAERWVRGLRNEVFSEETNVCCDDWH